MKQFSNIGYWIDSPNCDNICSECGMGSDTATAISQCPHCGCNMEIAFIYPSVECYENETGKNPWEKRGDNK